MLDAIQLQDQPPPPLTDRLTFSTDQVTSQQRLSAWRGFLAQRLLVAEVELPATSASIPAMAAHATITPHGMAAAATYLLRESAFQDGPSFKATVDILPLATSALAEIHVSRSRYEITPAVLDEARSDVLILLILKGRVSCTQRGRTVEVGPDEGTAIVANDIGTIEILDDHTVFHLLALPISSVSLLIRDLGEVVIRAFRKEDTARDLLAHYVGGLLELDGKINPSLADLTCGHITHLAGTALDALDRHCPAYSKRGVGSARKHAIKEEIVANLGRHDLTSDFIAERLGITARYLRRLLQDEGTSFSELARQLRAQRAHKLLNDPQTLSRSITELAYQVGFSDLSYFNRCFRRYYSQTPTEIRAEVARKLKLTGL